MAERLEAFITREYQAGGETKTAWTKVGIAFANKKGGYSVELEAIPAPAEGKFKFVLLPPQPKDDNRQPSGGASQSRGGGYSGGGNMGADDSDAIPFAPQVD